MVRRVLGWLLLALAALLFGAGLFNWATGNGGIAARLGQAWADIHGGSLTALQAVVADDLHPTLWRYLIGPVLETPIWSATPAVVAVAVLLLQRRRRRRFGLRD